MGGIPRVSRPQDPRSQQPQGLETLKRLASGRVDPPVIEFMADYLEQAPDSASTPRLLLALAIELQKRFDEKDPPGILGNFATKRMSWSVLPAAGFVLSVYTFTYRDRPQGVAPSQVPENRSDFFVSTQEPLARVGGALMAHGSLPRPGGAGETPVR